MLTRIYLAGFLMAAGASSQPNVEISSLIGGSGEDFVNDIALDENGDVLIVGATSSPDFPTADGAPSGAGPDLDAFFLRLREEVDAEGAPLWRIVQSEVFGGSADDAAQRLSVRGVVRVEGFTQSDDFPLGIAAGPFRLDPARLSETPAAGLKAATGRPGMNAGGPQRLSSGLIRDDPEVGVVVEDFVDQASSSGQLTLSRTMTINAGTPMESQSVVHNQVLARNSNFAAAAFLHVPLVANPFSNLYVVEDVNGSTCKITLWSELPETERTNSRFYDEGPSVNLRMESSVEKVAVVAGFEAVYVFKLGAGSFLTVEDDRQRIIESYDFLRPGNQLAVVCLDPNSLEAIKIDEQRARDIDDLLVSEDGKVTDLGKDFLGPNARRLTTRGSASVTAEFPRQQANPDLAITTTDLETLDITESLIFGGEGVETPTRGVVGEDGAIYITGFSDDAIPVTPGALRAAYGGGGSDGFLIKVFEPTPPVLAADAIVGAADFLAGPLAPGAILSAFSQGASSLVVAELDDKGKFPAALGGVRFLFDGDPGRMIFTTPGQSNLIAPFSLAGKSSVEVELEIAGLRSAPVELAVAPTRPQIFSASQQGTGQAALLNQDFSVNSAANPAERGSVIQIFLTGGGQTDPPGEDGGLAPTVEPLPRFEDVQVFVGGVECQVVYGGAAPGLVHGVGQINAVVNLDVAPGEAVELEVRIGGTASQAGITVAVS